MTRPFLTWVLLPALVLLASPKPGVAAPVDSSELARCHAVASRDQRLDCYEGLAAAAAPPGASAAPTGTAAAVPGSPAAPPLNPDDPANFGLSRHQLEAHSGAGGPAAIKSDVAQITEDRQHHITVVLDNGQTWVFIEPDSRLRPGDTVTIRRASLGSFLMLSPSRRSYRVERLK